MSEEVVYSALPLWAVLVPTIFTGLIALSSFYSARWRNFLSVVAALATLVVVLVMYPQVVAHKVIVYELSMIVSPLGLNFRVDGLSLLVAAISSFVWLAATIFALEYMNHEKNRGRFFTLLILTLAGTVGVPLAGDFLTLLLFFELMSLASYVLVVHTQTEEAYSAGDLYLYMGVFGGMSLLTGISIIYYYSGTLIIAPGSGVMGELTGVHYLAAILLIIGFGVKAGMAPLHIWLPRAHPVAPAPASALLSGIMIKVGAYGIIRVVNMLFVPAGEPHLISQAADHIAALWSTLSSMGYVVIWIGIITMFFGVCMAIIQSNIKKLLACSSISQMGFILVGIGVASYLGYDGAMGMAGSSYHIINHALFKSALFLAAGAIAYLTGELDMYKLGGLWEKIPFTTAMTLIASCGILGIPFFNGYASKTLLHHAIVEAFEHHHLTSLYVAEKIFTLTCAGTICYYFKFLYFTFLKKPDSGMEDVEVKKEPLAMKVGMGMLAVMILVIGIFPNAVLDRFINPALRYFVFDQHFIESHLVGVSFWTVNNLTSVAIALVLGTAFFLIGLRSRLFDSQVPYWLGQEFMASQIGRACIAVWNVLYFLAVKVVSIVGVIGMVLFRIGFRLLQQVDYRPGKSNVFRNINFSNIDFDMLLILVIFGVVLVFLFYLQYGVVAIAR